MLQITNQYHRKHLENWVIHSDDHSRPYLLLATLSIGNDQRIWLAQLISVSEAVPHDTARSDQPISLHRKSFIPRKSQMLIKFLKRGDNAGCFLVFGSYHFDTHYFCPYRTGWTCKAESPLPFSRRICQFEADTRRALSRNTTSNLFSNSQETYWGQFEELSKYNVHLNILERLWATWYVYMQNDTLATGIMSFLMHEIIYFGRALPWFIIDQISYFNKYKIQNVSFQSLCFFFLLKLSLMYWQQKIPTKKEQWTCASLVLLSHFTVELPQIW